ncbi:DNA primase [Microcella humidisoli]|uniref:DNA primase n=1 Tax=Microcella humidisoli TaxID=2963406 RepID=A0ABY5FVZ8_9MICO|nr:DNA primase [Microcella humidisoli]UTT62476.1 DNA primase [Microcella humidisoli]
MAGLIRRSDIDEVRSRTNLADIVGDYVTLKSAGVGSMKGLCPFHDERSPSFHVRPQVGFYHCFGCGEGGDVFTFLQKMDHVTFSEAVERLAGRLGYALHYEDGGPAADQGNRSRLLSANAAAEQFFRDQLGTPAAEPARRFLGERGFDAIAAERFSIGFAPNSYEALGDHLRGLGFTAEELLASGLQGQGDRKPYDRFRGRLIWPIKDVTGQTLGFGARKLLDTDNGPKYLNTPETPVYSKSKVLYGLDLAKRDIARGKQVVVVEGYTDVMACHLAGITTAVATCGTAFGSDHITIIRRVMGDVDNRDAHGLGEVVFTFDPDEAGQKAASRAFADEQRFAAQTYVAVAPDGLDPCDLRLQRGDDAVRLLIQGRKPMYEFMVRRQLDSYDLETVEGRVAALRATAPIVAGIRDESLSVGYTRTLAGWIGMDPTEVAQAVRAARRAPARTAPSRAGTAAGPGTSGAAEPAARIPVGDAAAAMADAIAPTIGIAQLPTDPVTRLERELLMALLQHPDEIPLETARRALHTTFSQPALATVRDALLAAIDAYGTSEWARRVADESPQAFSPLVTQLAIAPLPIREGFAAEYCRGVTTSLIERDLLRRKTELLGALQRTDATAEPERHRALQRELVELEAERRRVRGD